MCPAWHKSSPSVRVQGAWRLHVPKGEHHHQQAAHRALAITPACSSFSSVTG